MTKKNHKTGLLILSLMLLAFVSYGIFFVYKFNAFKNRVSVGNNGKNETFFATAENLVKNKSLDLERSKNNRINILLLGIAGTGKAGQNLTDTIMVASVNIETNQIALISIPRDLYVKIPDEKTHMKINSVYQYGLNKNDNEIEPASQTLEKIVNDITSLEINYFIVLNFDGFEEIIDSVNGINIINERDIQDDRYPGPNYSYETFELPRGFHELDGKTALKYVRERHDDPDGDFGRAKRQQQVMQSFRNKVFSVKTLLNVVTINDLFNALGDNIKTDIKPEEFGSFLELGKKIDTSNINNIVISAWEKDSLLRVSHVQVGDVRAFILLPRVGNYSELSEIAQNAFDLNSISRRKDEITAENAKVAIIDRTGNPNLLPKIKKLLQENFNYKNLIIIHENKKNISEKTIAFDLTNGIKPFTLDELVKKLPASASYEYPADVEKNISTDIIVTLGQDIISLYNIEEDSIEDYKKAQFDQDFQQYMEVMTK
jgi:polyisoprenyl-teichoic acid--peptidoglycan teichoic acid transferase